MLKILLVFAGIMVLPGNPSLSVNDEKKLDFPINTAGILDDKVQLYYAMMTDEEVMLSSNFSADISFEQHLKPLDIFAYDEKREEEEYYSLLTKAVYSLPQNVSFFSKERLSDQQYLHR